MINIFIFIHFNDKIDFLFSFILTTKSIKLYFKICFEEIAVVVKKDEYSAFERICTKFVGDANIIYLPFEDFENMNTFEILKKAAETYFNVKFNT